MDRHVSAFDRRYWIMIQGRRGRITYAGREVIGKDTKLLLGSVLFLLGNNSYLNSYFRRPATIVVLKNMFRLRQPFQAARGYLFLNQVNPPLRSLEHNAKNSTG